MATTVIIQEPERSQLYKRIRNLFENMINTDDITIRIVEN